MQPHPCPVIERPHSQITSHSLESTRQPILYTIPVLAGFDYIRAVLCLTLNTVPITPTLVCDLPASSIRAMSSTLISHRNTQIILGANEASFYVHSFAQWIPLCTYPCTRGKCMCDPSTVIFCHHEPDLCAENNETSFSPSPHADGA